MKHFVVILSFVVLGCLNSCVPDFQFEEPQPAFEENKSNFKNKYIGDYLNISDSSILTISSTSIVRERIYDGKISKSELDTMKNTELRDGFIYSVDLAEPIPYELIGDTIEYLWASSDTIFEISEKQVLRYFKGLYFLNTKEKEMWVVKLLRYDKGLIELKNIDGGEEEIEMLKQMTTVQEFVDDQGDTKYLLKPTKKELREILNSNLFDEGGRYQKIKR